MNKFFFLVSGIVIMIAFFVVAVSSDVDVNIFDRLYYNPEFNEHVYNGNLYPMIAAIITVISWGGAYLYYYVINSVSFARWYHWASIMLVAAVLSPLACYFFINKALNDAGLNMDSATLEFVIRLMALTAVLFIVASFSMRWWSSNCRHTPIPQ